MPAPISSILVCIVIPSKHGLDARNRPRLTARDYDAFRAIEKPPWNTLADKRWNQQSLKRARKTPSLNCLFRLPRWRRSGCGASNAAQVQEALQKQRFRLGKLQSLCAFHHNSTKKIIETRGSASTTSWSGTVSFAKASPLVDWA